MDFLIIVLATHSVTISFFFYYYSPSLGAPVPLYKPPVPEVIYVTSQQNTNISIATSISTDGGGSDDQLIPHNPPTPVGNPRLVYAQLNIKQTEVHPPTNDEPVHYAQIEYQD